MDHGGAWAPLHTDPLLPTYEGNGDYAEWFEQCEEIFDAKRVHPTSQLKFARLALRGMARTLVREKQPTTLLAMQELLSGRFRLPNEDFHLTTKLRSLVQQGDNLEVYLREFKFVAAKLPKLSDDDKRITFMNGLSAQVNLEVLRAKPLTFEAAEQAALDFYACRRYTKAQVTFQSNVVHDVNALYNWAPRDRAGAGYNQRNFRAANRPQQGASQSRRRSQSPRQAYRGSDNFRPPRPRSTDRAGSQSSSADGRYRDRDRERRSDPPQYPVQHNRGNGFPQNRGRANFRGRGRGRGLPSEATPMELDALMAQRRAQTPSPGRQHAPPQGRIPAGNDRR